MKATSLWWKPALALGLLGLIVAMVLALMQQLTGERIETQRQSQALEAVAAMLRPGSYDNELFDEGRSLALEGLEAPAKVYVAWLDEAPAAAVFDVTTEQGYSGPIRLLVAVDAAGSVLGVRVLEHRETPGLGDKIERRRGDWIEQFRGRSLDNPEPRRWKSDRRGGEFDTITSATVTSAAVTEAVALTLQGFATHRELLFATRPGPSSGPASGSGQ